MVTVDVLPDTHKEKLSDIHELLEKPLAKLRLMFSGCVRIILETMMNCVINAGFRVYH